MAETGSTRAVQLAEALAADIVSGRLSPGDSLDETELGLRFGVSRTPVREAIQSLTAIGLVSKKPRRGAVVAEPDQTAIKDMFLVMGEIEALCATLAARFMTVAERRNLESLHRAMRVHVAAGDAEAYARANVEFHGRLYRGAHNGYLLEMAEATRRRLAPFRARQLEAANRLAVSYAEHDAIVTAIARGDHANAATAVRAHIGVTEKTWAQLAAERRRTAPERELTGAL